MSHSVNVFIANWTNTGQTRRVDRWSVDVTLQWVDDAGASHEHNETLYFPDDLAGTPLNRLREYMQEIILRELRLRLGVDVEG